MIYNSDNYLYMLTMDDSVVDLTVTSPPYDDLRSYTNDSKWSFEKFKLIAKELFRVTKEGGVVVWIVNDETKNGGESGNSFRQALYFQDLGFKIHDTMIWNKGGFSAVGALQTRYAPVFEYMFIFCKGKLKTFNPLKDRKNKIINRKITTSKRMPDGSVKAGKSYTPSEYGQRFNIWEIGPQRQKGKCHPAPFPEKLIEGHILSWSNPCDLVFDPFLGSGTTGLVAERLNRDFLGIEISEEYFLMAKERMGIK